MRYFSKIISVLLVFALVAESLPAASFAASVRHPAARICSTEALSARALVAAHSYAVSLRGATYRLLGGAAKAFSAHPGPVAAATAVASLSTAVLFPTLWLLIDWHDPRAWAGVLSALSLVGGFVIQRYEKETSPPLGPSERNALIKRLEIHLRILELLVKMPGGNGFAYKVSRHSEAKYVLELKGDLESLSAGQILQIPESNLRFQIESRAGDIVIVRQLSWNRGQREIPPEGTVYRGAPRPELVAKIAVMRSVIQSLKDVAANLKKRSEYNIFDRSLGFVGLSPATEFKGIATGQFFDQRIPYAATNGEEHGDQSQHYMTLMAADAPQQMFGVGPPGTGKTTVIAEISKQAARAGKRVLIASEMHQAVDNALEDVENPRHLPVFVTKDGKETAYLPIHRVGNDPSKFKKGSAKYWPDENREFSPIPVEQRPKTSAIERFRTRRAKWAAVLKKPVKEMGSIFFAANAGSVLDSYLRKLRDSDPEFRFDLVIIDEASKTNVSTGFLPLSLLKPGGKAIIIGDSRQLATHPLDDDERRYLREAGITDGQIAQYEQSLFDFLLDRYQKGRQLPAHGDKIQLVTNRRSMEPIVEVVNVMYDGLLKAGRKDIPDPDCIIQVDLADEGRADNQWFQVGESNPRSADHVMRLIDFYHKTKRVPLSEITVIAAYREQVELLERRIAQKYQGEKDCPTVTTIDAFQGDEDKAVIVDFVVSNERGSVGFLKDIRRVNVALSRAADFLAVVWDTRTMGEAPGRKDSAEVAEARPVFARIKDVLSRLQSKTFRPLPKPVAPTVRHQQVEQAEPRVEPTLETRPLARLIVEENGSFQQQFRAHFLQPLSRAKSLEEIVSLLDGDSTIEVNGRLWPMSAYARAYLAELESAAWDTDAALTLLLRPLRRERLIKPEQEPIVRSALETFRSEWERAIDARITAWMSAPVLVPSPAFEALNKRFPTSRLMAKTMDELRSFARTQIHDASSDALVLTLAEEEAFARLALVSGEEPSKNPEIVSGTRMLQELFSEAYRQEARALISDDKPDWEAFGQLLQESPSSLLEAAMASEFGHWIERRLNIPTTPKQGAVLRARHAEIESALEKVGWRAGDREPLEGVLKTAFEAAQQKRAAGVETAYTAHRAAREAKGKDAESGMQTPAWLLDMILKVLLQENAATPKQFESDPMLPERVALALQESEKRRDEAVRAQLPVTRDWSTTDFRRLMQRMRDIQDPTFEAELAFLMRQEDFHFFDASEEQTQHRLAYIAGVSQVIREGWREFSKAGDFVAFLAKGSEAFTLPIEPLLDPKTKSIVIYCPDPAYFQMRFELRAAMEDKQRAAEGLPAVGPDLLKKVRYVAAPLSMALPDAVSREMKSIIMRAESFSDGLARYSAFIQEFVQNADSIPLPKLAADVRGEAGYAVTLDLMGDYYAWIHVVFQRQLLRRLIAAKKIPPTAQLPDRPEALYGAAGAEGDPTSVWVNTEPPYAYSEWMYRVQYLLRLLFTSHLRLLGATLLEGASAMVQAKYGTVRWLHRDFDDLNDRERFFNQEYAYDTPVQAWLWPMFETMQFVLSRGAVKSARSMYSRLNESNVARWWPWYHLRFSGPLVKDLAGFTRHIVQNLYSTWEDGRRILHMPMSPDGHWTRWSLQEQADEMRQQIALMESAPDGPLEAQFLANLQHRLLPKAYPYVRRGRPLVILLAKPSDVFSIPLPLLLSDELPKVTILSPSPDAMKAAMEVRLKQTEQLENPAAEAAFPDSAPVKSLRTAEDFHYEFFDPIALQPEIYSELFDIVDSASSMEEAAEQLRTFWSRHYEMDPEHTMDLKTILPELLRDAGTVISYNVFPQAMAMFQLSLESRFLRHRGVPEDRWPTTPAHSKMVPPGSLQFAEGYPATLHAIAEQVATTHVEHLLSNLVADDGNIIFFYGGIRRVWTNGKPPTTDDEFARFTHRADKTDPWSFWDLLGTRARLVELITIAGPRNREIVRFEGSTEVEGLGYAASRVAELYISKPFRSLFSVRHPIIDRAMNVKGDPHAFTKLMLLALACGASFALGPSGGSLNEASVLLMGSHFGVVWLISSLFGLTFYLLERRKRDSSQRMLGAILALVAGIAGTISTATDRDWDAARHAFKQAILFGVDHAGDLLFGVFVVAAVARLAAIVRWWGEKTPTELKMSIMEAMSRGIHIEDFSLWERLIVALRARAAARVPRIRLPVRFAGPLQTVLRQRGQASRDDFGALRGSISNIEDLVAPEPSGAFASFPGLLGGSAWTPGIQQHLKTLLSPEALESYRAHLETLDMMAPWWARLNRTPRAESVKAGIPKASVWSEAQHTALSLALLHEREKTMRTSAAANFLWKMMAAHRVPAVFGSKLPLWAGPLRWIDTAHALDLLQVLNALQFPSFQDASIERAVVECDLLASLIEKASYVDRFPERAAQLLEFGDPAAEERWLELRQLMVTPFAQSWFRALTEFRAAVIARSGGRSTPPAQETRSSGFWWRGRPATNPGDRSLQRAA